MMASHMTRSHPEQSSSKTLSTTSSLTSSVPTSGSLSWILLLIFRDKGKTQAYIACVLRPQFWHKETKRDRKNKSQKLRFWRKHPVFPKRLCQDPLLGFVQSLDNCLEYLKYKGSHMSTKFKENTSSSTDRISLLSLEKRGTFNQMIWNWLWNCTLIRKTPPHLIVTVADDGRTPWADVIDILIAVHVPGLAAFHSVEDNWLSTHRLKCPHGRVHTSWHQILETSSNQYKYIDGLIRSHSTRLTKPTIT